MTGARGPIAVANRLLTPDGVAIRAFGLRAVVGLAMILRTIEYRECRLSGRTAGGDDNDEEMDSRRTIVDVSLVA